MTTPAPASRTATAMTVTEPGAPLRPRPVQLTEPQRGWVRVDVVASGVCYADLDTAEGSKASEDSPVTPGHEVAGVIAELGEGVVGWTVGDRVSVGWFGGSCGHCAFCRTGDVVHCAQRQVPGMSYPGGWADSIAVPADALARIPDDVDFIDAAPMGCAGVTTYNAIRNAHLAPGATVAVFGVGGLGHLAVQFAAAMGYRTIAIARGPERAGLARELGAAGYLDSAERPAGAALADLGGADLIVCTAPTTEPVAELLGGLRVGGRLTLIGVDAGSVEVPVAQMVMNAQVLTGHLTGSAHDTEEAMRFAAANGVRPMVERMPLSEANEALTRIRAGKPRFRIVLEPAGHH
jgi:D-arabinose 1-dehydrogenase-like Zn-dependent alcohol dehydrogenase